MLRGGSPVDSGAIFRGEKRTTTVLAECRGGCGARDGECVGVFHLTGRKPVSRLLNRDAGEQSTVERGNGPCGTVTPTASAECVSRNSSDERIFARSHTATSWRVMPKEKEPGEAYRRRCASPFSGGKKVKLHHAQRPRRCRKETR